MIFNEFDDEIQEYLKSKNCRGCSNRCALDNPECNRSKLWIKEAIEEWKTKRESR